MGGNGVAAVRTRDSSCEDDRRSMQREIYRYQGDYRLCTAQPRPPTHASMQCRYLRRLTESSIILTINGMLHHYREQGEAETDVHVVQLSFNTGADIRSRESSRMACSSGTKGVAVSKMCELRPEGLQLLTHSTAA